MPESCSASRPISNRDLGVQFVMANDANCFALAEATLGAARGFPTVFGVILGTGVGGGIVVNGQVLNGCHGIAGEWGQIVLDPDGPVSNYGTRGTVEAMICGPALERFYAAQSGEKRKLKEIVDARRRRHRSRRAGHDRAPDRYLRQSHRPHHRRARSARDRARRRRGQHRGALHRSETREKITAAIFNPTFEAALLKPTLGDSAGVFGAAMLVKS